MTAVRKNQLHHNIPSPIKMEGQSPMKLQEGIVTILRSDNTDRTNCKTAASIRRTLSADMSSKKWLQQNGFFSPMKKIASSEILSSEGYDECDKNLGQDDVWRSIQAQKERDADGSDQMLKPTPLAVWGSILQSQKSDGGSDFPPPYVHPLVKRSASTLSEKSLEVCTESLGSETGSDVFSSYPDSESSTDADDQKLEREECLKAAANRFEDLQVVKYRGSPARSFPPPLASIAGGGDGSSIHVHSHRENGRLVVEAVSVQPRNFFRAERSDGRLVLTLMNSEEDDGGHDGYDEETEEEEEVVVVVEEKIKKEVEFVMEEKLSGIISFQKSGVLMNKFIALRNNNPTWNMKAAEHTAAEVEKFPVPQSLPPLPPPVARLIPSPQPAESASFNPYEYFWRNKTTATGGGTGQQLAAFKLNKNTGNINSVKSYENHHQELVLNRGKRRESFVPYIKGCKEPKRSLLIWEPYCIATS